MHYSCIVNLAKYRYSLRATQNEAVYRCCSNERGLDVYAVWTSRSSYQFLQEHRALSVPGLRKRNTTARASSKSNSPRARTRFSERDA